ncbi:thioesterase II family protein [Streptosporangium sp. NPDC000396]|uniref:thioesterase II family protein n=1 Tax=Streptosporangium sp. NPDC000396 TaxID=3366185 RepID=UPI0036A6B37F
MTAADLWIRCFHPSPRSDVQVVCFPHAGGSASYYRPLSGALSPSAEMLAVQYPGRQDRYNEPPVTDIHLLADQIADVLGRPGDRPRAFFGHSMGATVAFEVARRLTSGAPIVLFASGRRAPSSNRHETRHLLGDDELVTVLDELSGTDAAVLEDKDLRELVLPVVRSDYRAIETYRYTGGPPLDCPIVAFTGDADPMTSLEEARAWSEHTRAGFELRVFPGGHFFVGDDQAAVAQAILEALRKVHA